MHGAHTHRGAWVIGTDALRILLVSPEPSDGQEHKQDTKGRSKYLCASEQPCRRFVPRYTKQRKPRAEVPGAFKGVETMKEHLGITVP
jgi:predicted RNA-binding protein YlxR (DUF448 family)